MSTQPLAPATASIQSQTLDAVVAILGGADANVFRCQMEAFTAEQLPADNVLPDGETAEYADTFSIDLRHRFTVRHTAQSGNGVDVTVDARYLRAARLLLSDPTLGGLVRYTRYLARKWEFQSGELDTVALAVTYEAEFSTFAADPGYST